MKKVCCQLLLFLVALSSFGQGAKHYKTTKLEEVAKLLSLELPSQHSFGYYFQTWKTYPIVIHVNDEKIINHIGLRLFNREGLQDKDLSVVFDFVERYLLELLVINDKQQLASVLRSDNVRLEYGDFPDLKKISDALLLKIKQDETRRYHISWTDTQTNKIIYSFSFPIQYELILGMNKIEIENDLPQNIIRQLYNIEIAEPVRKENIKLVPQTKYYMKQGDKYIIESLNSNLYYEQSTNGKLQLMANTKYPVESLANLMIAEDMEHGYQLDITQNKYGYKTAHFSVPLKQWIRYCLHSGCVPYFGLESQNEDEMRASVVMENKKLAYNHILYITFPKNLLTSSEGAIKAKLHAYIPTHNVTDLYFEEREGLDKKQKK